MYAFFGLEPCDFLYQCVELNLCTRQHIWTVFVFSCVSMFVRLYVSVGIYVSSCVSFCICVLDLICVVALSDHVGAVSIFWPLSPTWVRCVVSCPRSQAIEWSGVQGQDNCCHGDGTELLCMWRCTTILYQVLDLYLASDSQKRAE